MGGQAGKGCSLLLTSHWLELGHIDGKEAGKCRVAVCSGGKRNRLGKYIVVDVTAFKKKFVP